MYANKNFKVTIVDDSPAMSEMIKDFINEKFKGAAITSFKTGEDALKGIYEKPDVIILDYHLDSTDPLALNGLQILLKLKEMYDDVTVIFLSAEEKAEIAANTIKYGAYDYLVKNETAFHRLEIILNNILSHGELKKNLGGQKFFNRLLAVLLVSPMICRRNLARSSKSKSHCPSKMSDGGETKN